MEKHENGGIGQASPRDAKAIFEAIDTKAIFLPSHRYQSDL